MTLPELAAEHDAEVRRRGKRAMIQGDRAYYYRIVEDEDGTRVERMGPWPANGSWPAIYAARGFSLVSPEQGQEEPEAEPARKARSRTR